MTQYDNTNRGTIAKNTHKTEDNHPDIAGQINVEGRDYWINGWQKTNSKDGSKFYSLTVKPKEQRQERQQPARQQSNRDDPRTSYGGGMADLDDDVPFAPEWR